MIDLSSSQAGAIADAILMGGGVAVVEHDDPGAASEFREELELLDETTPVETVEGVASAEQVWNAVERHPRSTVVISGLVKMDDAELVRLDLHRNRMLRTEALVFLLGPTDAVRLRQRAPNMASWVGGHWFRLEQASAESLREERLGSLREERGLSDEKLVDGVETGRIDVDPPVAEWLALLGRGDLISRG